MDTLHSRICYIRFLNWKKMYAVRPMMTKVSASTPQGGVAGGLRAVVPKISYRTAVILQLTVWLVNSASGVLRAKHMHTNARIKYIL